MCRTFGQRPSEVLGLLEPLLKDDVDILASELLKAEDPDPQEMMMYMMMGKANDDPQVVVDGVPY